MGIFHWSRPERFAKMAPEGQKYSTLKDSGPNSRQGHVFLDRNLKYWVLGPSGGMKVRTEHDACASVGYAAGTKNATHSPCALRIPAVRLKLPLGRWRPDSAEGFTRNFFRRPHRFRKHGGFRPWAPSTQLSLVWSP